VYGTALRFKDSTDGDKGAGFRVLALDGGGIRGLFITSFLSTLEELGGGRVGEHFDLIVGTSTGGIIALALACGAPARAVFDLFLQKGRQVFARPRHLGMLLRPKYDNHFLIAALRDFFGTKVMNDVSTPVCVTSYELENSYPRIWKDDHAADLVPAGDELAWKVALATSAAPIFFPGAQVSKGDSHVDGGLFANNPTLIGLTEAAEYFRQPLDQIRVLSVGAGERAERIPYEKARRMGVWYWRTAAIEHMLIAQARISHEIARRLLGPKQYVRVNVPLERPYPLDDYDAARNLIEPGAQAARVHFPDLKKRFFSSAATRGRDQKAAVRAMRLGDPVPDHL
jgi:patatin-like phospholipase/acyl hydrolase